MGIVAATGLLALSIWESILVLEPYGMAWMVSVCTLMLIGYIIEIMILKETMFATQMELYQNKDQWRELQEFYIAREQFASFMDELYDGKIPELQTTLNPPLNLDKEKKSAAHLNGTLA